MTSRLFDRRWQIQIAGVDVSELDVEFDVYRSVRREPNTGAVTIYNSAPNVRAQFERGSEVNIRAGYASEGQPPILFVGRARDVRTERQGIDTQTVVEARDGGDEFVQARFSKGYAAGTLVTTVLRDLVTTLGVGLGNLDEFESAFSLRNGATTFSDGYAVSGPAARSINALVRGAGLRWSVQNNAFTLIERGRTLQTSATVLSPETGLVGSPTREKGGKINVTVLLQSGLEPGRRVVIQSADVTGGYQILRNNSVGETRGTNWYAKLQCRPL